MTATRDVSIPEMTAEQRRVYRAREALHRDGASPAGALELLAAIVSERTWERLVDKDGRPFTGRFREFVKKELGCDPAELPKVINLRHPRETVPQIAEEMAAMRAAVQRLLLEDVEPAAQHGQIGRNRQRTTLSKSPDSDTAERKVRRLKRDDPELAERVVNGEVSAYAAARAKGWQPPRIQVRTPEQVARQLREHMTPESLAELVRLLAETDA